MRYAITGATGHIGQRIAELLLVKKMSVRVVGRSAEKLKSLVAAGAEACVGDVEDKAFMTRVFDKVDAVFTMIPPNPQAEDFRAYQNRVGLSIAHAVKKAGVTRIVNLSSQGAHLQSGTGPIAGLYDQEQRLNGMTTVSVVHLRPTFFMENLMMNIGLIKLQNINGSPMKGDLMFPMIATRDIAAAAVDCILETAFAGNTVRDLLGERDLSMNQVTRILGNAIGKPDLTYVQFPYEAAEKAMVDMGLSKNLASLYIEMHRAFNEGLIMTGLKRTTSNTTKTSIEAFARDFAGAYKRA